MCYYLKHLSVYLGLPFGWGGASSPPPKGVLTPPRYAGGRSPQKKIGLDSGLYNLFSVSSVSDIQKVIDFFSFSYSWPPSFGGSENNSI
jgi:hypothetical protein